MPHEYHRTEEVLLQLDNVCLSFGSKVVLNGVNTIIHRFEHPNKEAAGRIICFLGPSGIGKTQTSRIIAGLQQPTAGQVLLRGNKPVAPGDVCMVPQNYPMFDYATVAQNLAIAGKQGGLTAQAANIKATGYIHEFGLAEHLAKYPRELSGGTKQRVAIARQLMCTGHYMVMDEPFSGLDPVSKANAMEAIVKLGALDSYNTIIIVTHDIASGLAVSDKVWLLGLEAGKPGARIVEEIDLAALGFSWRSADELQESKDFQMLIREITTRFKSLKPQGA